MKKITIGLMIIIFSIRVESLTLNVDSMGVKPLLYFLSQYTNQNVIVSDQVKGEMTLNLVNVTWEQALQAILKSQGLSEETINAIVYIKPVKNKQKKITLPRMVLAIIPLNYAKAKSIENLLKPQLVSGEVVSSDHRENALVIKASAANLIVLKQLIKQLDQPVSQIMINAKLVNVDQDYLKALGIQFGLTSGHQFSQTGKSANVLAIDAAASHSGVALIKLANDTFLDAEISALESQGHANLVSNPELIAANEETATIESGQEIPYQEQAGEGATNVAFKKAVLSLQVTPQVIPNHKILLHLKVTQDRRSVEEVLGVPAIDTHQIETNVLLNNKETIVLGGIYDTEQTNDNQRVPFASSLPIIGPLFQYNKITEVRRQLLIFVTPTLLNE